MRRHGDRLLAGSVGEGVGVGHQVEEVVGVEVGDRNGVDVDVVAVLPQLREDPVAAIEQQGVVALLDQVAAACAPRILPGR